MLDYGINPSYDNRPQKRKVQRLLTEQLIHYSQTIPQLKQGTAIVLSGTDLELGAGPYIDLADEIYLAEWNKDRWKKISQILNTLPEQKWEKVRLIASDQRREPTDILDVASWCLAQEKNICGADFDLDRGKTSSLSTYIEQIGKKFLGRIQTPAFWARIAAPVRPEGKEKRQQELSNLLSNPNLQKSYSLIKSDKILYYDNGHSLMIVVQAIYQRKRLTLSDVPVLERG